MSKNVAFPLPVVGMDMLSDQTSLVKGAVRDAVNVDIGRGGTIECRGGFSRIVADPTMHSVWSAAQKGWVLLAKGSTLCRLNTTTYETTALMSLGSAHPVSYTEYNGNIYFTNKHTVGWVPSDSTVARVVGVPTPAAPTLSAAAGGLLPGKYAVTISLLDDRGEEGGTCEVQFMDLPAGGGIRLSNLPEIVGWSIAVYVSPADGDMLHFNVEIPAVFSAYTVGEQSNGSECGTQYLVPLPPGDFIRWFNGRLYTAANGTLKFSEAMRPHLHNPAYGVIPFSGHIAFVEPVAGGIFVGDSRGVWFLGGGDPTKFDFKLVSTHRAVAKSSISIPAANLPEKFAKIDMPIALWLSEAGYVAGMPDGTVSELQSDRIRLTKGLTGRTTFLMRKGRKQIVTPVNSTSTTVIGTAVDSDIP